MFVPPTKFYIFGERCSGTNYVRSLIELNMGHNMKLADEGIYGWKHRFIKTDDLGRESDTVFIVVARNPYDWIRSFHEQPHHALKCRSMSMMQFLKRSPWSSEEKGKQLDFDPVKKELVSDVMKLRTRKYQQFFTLEYMVDHFMFVRYEDVKEKPQEFIHTMCDMFNLTASETFVPVKLYKGLDKEKDYVPKKYKQLADDELDVFEEGLDWTLEEKMGYYRITN